MVRFPAALMRFSFSRCVLGLVLILWSGCLYSSVAAAPVANAQTSASSLQASVQPGDNSEADHGGGAGNGASGSGNAEAVLVAEVVLLLLVGRLLGEAMQRLGQPALIGNLLAGLVLGPSLFGLVWPEAQKFLFPPAPAQKAMIDGISQIGILMLLLLTGMETDLKLVSRMKGAAIAVSLSDIAVPFALGFLLGQFLPASLLPQMIAGRLVPSLFLGTALSISSIKIVAMV